MAKPILQDGDPVLDQIAAPVPAELFGTPELRQILKDMEDALDGESDGVALAAPQIGISYRIFIVRFDRTASPLPETASAEEKAEAIKPKLGVFINPVFVNSSRKRVEMDEGCLSVRTIYGTTFRHERATVRAYDENGNVFERGGGGLIAQIYQHETDHLDGILFVDHAINLTKVIRKKDGEEVSQPLRDDLTPEDSAVQ
jgi:peptide deformylase